MTNKVSKELQDTVDQNLHIDHVHFTADGHHHFRVFQHGKDLFTRLEEVPEKTKSNISTGKFILAPIKNHKGEIHPAHLVTETVSREEILKAKPVTIASAPSISAEDVYAALQVTPEELAAFMASKRKK